MFGLMVEEEGGGGVTGYIRHHLTHLTVALRPNDPFLALHLDSVVFNVVLATILITVLAVVARRATAGVPGKFQAFVEILVEFVDDMVENTFHGKNAFIAPLVITIFCLTWVENFMDILPVDLLPAAAHAAGIEHLRTVTTADINTTLGMAIGVFFLIQWVGITHKGLGLFIGEWFTAPFHAHNPLAKILLAPINFLLRLIEEAVRPVSLALRLFGNMYAGEIIFLLIACFTLGANFNHVATWLLGLGELVAGIAWTVFHYLIITLQAFIFAVLTLVYVSIAAERH